MALNLENSLQIRPKSAPEQQNHPKVAPGIDERARNREIKIRPTKAGLKKHVKITQSKTT